MRTSNVREEKKGQKSRYLYEDRGTLLDLEES